MTTNNETVGQPLPKVDRLIHEPARYNIMALLFVVERADFLFVQNQTGLTPGNLSSHLGKLETARYVRVKKTYVGKVPKTYLNITDDGRTAFEIYREQMSAVFSPGPATAGEDDDSGETERKSE